MPYFFPFSSKATPKGFLTWEESKTTSKVGFAWNRVGRQTKMAIVRIAFIR